MPDPGIHKYNKVRASCLLEKVLNNIQMHQDITVQLSYYACAATKG